LAEDVLKFVSPIREKINYYKNDQALLAKVARIGAEKANASAEKTLKEVREIIGFRRFY
jgi:tryptophanyl-tRNA synthetase